jgi:AcrR family transcriptional regulator
MAEATRARELSKQETREALLTAAMAEFAERGLDAPSLDAICARAGFTRGAFYVHFRDREDLVAAVMERVLGAFLDAVVARSEGAGDLDATVQRFAASVAALRGPGARGAAPPNLADAWGGPGVPFHQVLAACQRAPELRRRFVSILEEAIRRVAGAARSEGRVAPDAVATLLVLTALGVRVALDLDLAFDVAQVRDAALRLFAAPAAGRVADPPASEEHT